MKSIDQILAELKELAENRQQKVVSLVDIETISKDKDINGKYRTLRQAANLLIDGHIGLHRDNIKGLLYEADWVGGDVWRVKPDSTFITIEAVPLLLEMEVLLYNTEYIELEKCSELPRKNKHYDLLFNASSFHDGIIIVLESLKLVSILDNNYVLNLDLSRLDNTIRYFELQREQYLIMLGKLGKYANLEIHAKNTGVVIADEIRHNILADLYSYEEDYRIDYYNYYRYPLEVFSIRALDIVFFKNNLI